MLSFASCLFRCFASAMTIVCAVLCSASKVQRYFIIIVVNFVVQQLHCNRCLHLTIVRFWMNRNLDVSGRIFSIKETNAIMCIICFWATCLICASKNFSKIFWADKQFAQAYFIKMQFNRLIGRRKPERKGKREEKVHSACIHETYGTLFLLHVICDVQFKSNTISYF